MARVDAPFSEHAHSKRPLNDQLMRNTMELVLRLIMWAKARSHLLFKPVLDVVSLEKTIELDATLLAEPWLRDAAWLQRCLRYRQAA